VEFRILGPLEVVRETGPVVLPRGRGRALLALLVLRAGEVVAADRLIDELWGPTPPPTANKSLHNLISDLRRRLGSGPDAGEAPAILATAGSGYVLQINPHQVDAVRFRRLLAEASGAPAEERAAELRTALGLWRGPALADFAYEPFAQTEIAVLEELRLTAIEDRIDADLALGRHAGLVGELEALAPQHPFRERLQAQLMLGLYRCGRQADALEVYRAARRALVEELGIEPGPALTGLQRAILGQDPSLEPSAEPPGEAATVEPLLEAEPWLGGERKTVTVAYVELVESTTAGGADPELTRRLLARGIEVASGACDRHGGTVEGFIGGVLVAVFGLPAAHEDDALRAARAAVELREAVAALHAGPERDPRVRLVARVGINTGEVLVGDSAGGPAAASGDAVTLAARLQQAAGDGEVLVGETTRRLLGNAARVEPGAALVLDRRGRPATVWRLVDLIPGAPGLVPDRAQALIGRKGELTRLHAAFQPTLRQRRASRFTMIGEAGVGKSRLALAFVEALASEIEVFSCRCPAYGEGITFWPLRELMLQAIGDRGPAGITALLAGQDDADAVAAQIAGAIGLRHEPGAGKELFPAVRRLLETLARSQPVVVVVDDAHWAQPTFLDLVDYLAEFIDAPVLIVCLARPELLDQRPAWVSEPGDAASLVLEPLAPDDSERLIVHRLAGRLVPDDVVTQIVEMAQGNPLFIEQLLAALRDEGKLRFPPSVHALLAARIDRLGPAERDLLRCASVIGAEFSREALTALIPDRVHRFLDRHLEALQRKEFVRPARRSVHGGRAFTFRHVLIQQAAYRSTTREVRAELHEQLADWLERTDAPQLEEVVAYHLEQAHEQRRQLGLDDNATCDLALRAGERLAQAGLRAYRRFDMTAAENLLSRARALLPADHPERYEVLRRLAEAYPTLGRLTDAEAVLAEMLADPRAHQSARLEQRLRLEQLRIRLIAGPDPVRQDTIRSEVARALEMLEPLGDDIGISQACYLLATMYLRSGQIRELTEIARRGLDHARRSGDLREQLGALWWPSWALVVGPTPVPDAIRTCEELLRTAPGEHAGVLTDLARLKAMLGEFDEARELVGRARRQLVERMRVRRALTVLAHRSAQVEILAGDLEAAERTLHQVIEVALDIGERDQTAQIAAELSRVLSARDATDEANRFAALSRQQAPAESVAAQALWRTATARVMTLRGDAEAAHPAQEAIACVPIDMVNLRADLLLDLAVTLLATGGQDKARAVLDEAMDLYERKGNLVGARRTRRLSAE
jgi:DNA-binding SARP family transcriptional activator/tetratricopeptide (TPR) repeat protein